MKTRPRRDADQVWELLVSLVMETRGDWRRKVTEATGLRFSRIRALTRLQDGPRTLSELAEAMSIDAPAATVIVNDLESRGLVERQALADDRRVKRVSLTAEGRRRVAAVNRIEDPPPAAFDDLSAAQLAQLRRVLEASARD